MRNWRFVAALWVALSAGLVAGEIAWEFKTDKPAIDYHAGDEATVTIKASVDGAAVTDKRIRWRCDGDVIADPKKDHSEGIGISGQPVEIKIQLTRPGFTRIDAKLCEADGKTECMSPDPNGKLKPLPSMIRSIGADIEKIRGGTPPADFDAFWEKQLAELAQVPVEILEKKEVPFKAGVKCYDVKVRCLGGRPLSGYLTVPENAAAKSLPASINFYYYSVIGAGKPGYDKTRICFSVNAHGIDNGAPATYYKELAQNELKGYGFSNNADPEKSYFRDMILRDVRAVDFIKTLPEWDGKNISLWGSSQGGFQVLCVAGLRPEVTRAHADIPWMCDPAGAKEFKRQKSYFRPSFEPGLAYYDTVFFAPRIKAETVIDAGLSDYVCPPTGVMACYNALPELKTIHWAQGRVHGKPAPQGAEMFTRSNKDNGK